MANQNPVPDRHRPPAPWAWWCGDLEWIASEWIGCTIADAYSFPGSAWERTAPRAPPSGLCFGDTFTQRNGTGGGSLLTVRSQAEPGNELLRLFSRNGHHDRRGLIVAFDQLNFLHNFFAFAFHDHIANLLATQIEGKL